MSHPIALIIYVFNKIFQYSVVRRNHKIKIKTEYCRIRVRAKLRVAKVNEITRCRDNERETSRGGKIRAIKNDNYGWLCGTMGGHWSKPMTFAVLMGYLARQVDNGNRQRENLASRRGTDSVNRPRQDCLINGATNLSTVQYHPALIKR